MRGLTRPLPIQRRAGIVDDGYRRINRKNWSFFDMTATFPFSILPIHPPQIRSAMPPQNLMQAKTIFSGSTTRTYRDDSGWHGLSDGGKGLPHLLARLAARWNTIHFLCPDEMEPTRLNVLMAALKKQKPDFRLSLSCILGEDVAPDFIDMADDHAIVQIQWRVTGPLPDFRFFKGFSRAGIWNHLVLDGAAASPENGMAVTRQPNLIHSWEIANAAVRTVGAEPSYGQVRPLPGQPLWQAAQTPVERFLLVDRLTRDCLLRLRVDDDGDSLYTVGDNLAYHFLPPDQLPDGYLDEICAMVAAGGTVATTHVRANLERAFLIGYAEERGVIVGNSSLKNPRPAYIDSVRRRSGLDLAGYVERGYTSVRPEYRGLGVGTTLLEGLTQRAGDRKIFSVIAEDNEATKIIAIRNRTRQVATYFSEKAGKSVGIWMPEKMIDAIGSKRS
jgi:GNAT superfamily N-acetyltransferase